MELKSVTDRINYISGKGCVIIDSGVDEDSAKRIIKILEENNLLPLVAIINTHSHADHCGGNRYLKDKTKARIYAPEIESAIITFPYLEPLYLFSGASPLKDLQNKFLMAQPSEIDYVIKKEESKIVIEGLELGIVPLPGHSPNQIGIGIDDVLFCADSIFSEEVINKHKIPFFTDIEQAKKTLKFLRESPFKFYVPSHAEPRSSLAELADINLNVIDGIEKKVLDITETRKSSEEILRDLCNHYQIFIKGIQQYYLMNTVGLAYLSLLKKEGKLRCEVIDNLLFWQRN